VVDHGGVNLVGMSMSYHDTLLSNLSKKKEVEFSLIKKLNEKN
jgi:hypothetical protein